MTSDREWMLPIAELTEKLFDEGFAADEHATLNQLLSQGPEQRGYYLSYNNLLTTLERRSRVVTPFATMPFDSAADLVPPASTGVQHSLIDPQPSPPEPQPLVIDMFPGGDGTDGPSLSPSPILGFLGTAYHGVSGYIGDHEWAQGVLGGTVFLALLFAVLGSIEIFSRWRQANRPQPTTEQVVKVPAVRAAKLTGVFDCRWTGSFHPPRNEVLNVDDYINLASGLAEVTYDSGESPPPRPLHLQDRIPIQRLPQSRPHDGAGGVETLLAGHRPKVGRERGRG